MPNNNTQGNVPPNRLIGRRIESHQKKPQVLLGENPPRFTMNAFYDNRGPLSVDVFWVDQQLKPKDQKDYLEWMKEVCELEAFNIVGWAFCKVSTLTDKAQNCVSQVVLTPTNTNDCHADIERKSFLVSADQGDPERTNKSQAFAQLLKDFYNTYGSYESLV